MAVKADFSVTKTPRCVRGQKAKVLGERNGIGPHFRPIQRGAGFGQFIAAGQPERGQFITLRIVFGKLNRDQRLFQHRRIQCQQGEVVFIINDFNGGRDVFVLTVTSCLDEGCVHYVFGGRQDFVRADRTSGAAVLMDRGVSPGLVLLIVAVGDVQVNQGILDCVIDVGCRLSRRRGTARDKQGRTR